MIGINTVTLIGTTDRTRTNAKNAARFWLNTSVRYTDREGVEKTLEDSVLCFTPAIPKGRDGQPIKDGSLVLVVGELANTEIPRQGAEPLKVVQVVAQAMSRVEAGTPHINRLIWAASLGADPEMRYTSQGHAVCDLRLVLGGDREQNIPGVWLYPTLWRGQAEYANRVLSKGSRVTIEGRVYTEEWTSKDGAKSGLRTKCHANDLLAWEPPQAPPQAREGAPVARANGAPATKAAAPVVDDGVFEESVDDLF